MTTPEGRDAARPTPTPPTPADTRRAKLMFVLAALFTTAAAVTFGRADQPARPGVAIALATGLLLLWPVFVAEAAWGVVRRDRARPSRPVLVRGALAALFPPLRAGLPDPRTGLIWLPRRGWDAPGRELVAAVGRVLSAPTLVVATAALPVLALDVVAPGGAGADQTLSTAVRLAAAAVWLAFTAEFVLKVWASPDPLGYASARWADLLVVLLPVLLWGVTRSPTVAAAASAVRVGEGQLGRRAQLGSLQGMALKACGAAVVIGAWVRWRRCPGSRLRAARRQLRRARARVAEAQASAADARQEHEDLKRKLRPEMDLCRAAVRVAAEVPAKAGG